MPQRALVKNVPSYISLLDPDYVAPRLIRSLRSKKSVCCVGGKVKDQSNMCEKSVTPVQITEPNSGL